MPMNRNAAMGNGNQMMDLMKANMLMNSKDNPIYTFFIMTILEVVMKYLNLLIEMGKRFTDKWIDRKFNRVVGSLPIGNSDDIKCEIIFDRNFTKSQKIEEYTKVDAVLMRVMEVPAIERIIFSRARYMINYKDPIEIRDNIKFQLIENTFDADGEIETVKFRIFSSTQNAANLKQFIARCESDYEMIKKNKLGDDIFFFDQVLLNAEQKKSDLIPNKTLFHRNLFLTNRNLKNVFFEQKPEVETRLDLFEHHKEWYDRRGIPHTLGLLLFGSPGCGKTSLLKAIANITKRHIINVNFGKIKSKTMLKQLFYDDKLWVMEKADLGENLDSYIIPIHKRLYVLEDLDAVEGSPLLRRDLEKEEEEVEETKVEEEVVEVEKDDKDEVVEDQLRDLIAGYSKKENKKDDEKKESAEEKNESVGNQVMDKMMNIMMEMKDGNNSSDTGPMFPNKQKQSSKESMVPEKKSDKEKKKEEEESDDKLDLSAVLNILDGTLETPGRMLIITSNYPEKLDQALIRPGRIDMIIEFKKANHQTIHEMYECYFEEKADPELVEQIPEYLWTPAELGQILFKNFKNPPQALTDLITNTPEEYFRFSYFDKFDEKEDDKEEN